MIYDLTLVEPSLRRNTWSRWVSDAFAGLEVDDISEGMPIGVLRCTRINFAKVWTTMTTSQSLRRSQCSAASVARSVIVVLRQGCQIVAQDGRRSRLGNGDLCFIDGSKPFFVETLGACEATIVELPHASVIARLPNLPPNSALVARASQPEVRLFTTVLDALLAQDGRFLAECGSAALDALLAVAAALPLRGVERPDAAHWRVRQALQAIDERLDDDSLTPEVIAGLQHISRRRLDALFRSEIGSTIAAQILEHRLAKAALLLSGGEAANLPVTEIAFRCGFKEVGHFSRSFRRRFDVPPSQFRAAIFRKADLGRT